MTTVTDACECIGTHRQLTRREAEGLTFDGITYCERCKDACHPRDKCVRGVIIDVLDVMRS
jgi:hypothetical protein